MPDGSTLVDVEVSVGVDTDLQIAIDKYLDIPERINRQKQNKLGNEIALFLAKNGTIKRVETWRGSWGFKWESEERAIYKSEQQMPPEMYDKYVVRLGKDENTGEPLYPQPDEMDKYRFLHEVGHAFQDYQIGKDGDKKWYDRAVAGEINSPFAVLFDYCYKLRTANSGNGLTTWGSQADYGHISEPTSRNALGAIEDVNELVTMYLWHPKYFEAHMKYLAQEISGYGIESLSRDGLTPITSEKKTLVSELVADYVAEARKAVEVNSS